MFEEWISITASMTLKFVAKDLSISYVFRNCNSMKFLNFADHDINVIREKSFLTNIQLNIVVRTAFIAVFCCQVYLMMLPCCHSEFIYLYSYSYILFRFHLDHHTDWHWRSKPKGEGIFIFLSINAKMKKIYYYTSLLK